MISLTVSQKPTIYMATPTALANEKMRPMAPPNSGPRDLKPNVKMSKSKKKRARKQER